MTSLRIGHGIDAHRLVEGRRLMLGGVHVDFDRGLEGHSDGDAVAHALADAILGGAGLGDIGVHFPSAEERWRDVSGVDLLRSVASMARDAGWEVSSAQVVALAEQPRLAPYVAAMSVAMAGALGVTAERVAVSASTTDGMGLVGRLEGIVASAVVLLAPIS
jgi:2-C-methyl-D-erythritol 2,4-cyclodiphosphate synthase